MYLDIRKTAFKKNVRHFITKKWEPHHSVTKLLSLQFRTPHKTNVREDKLFSFRFISHKPIECAFPIHLAGIIAPTAMLENYCVETRSLYRYRKIIR